MAERMGRGYLSLPEWSSSLFTDGQHQADNGRIVSTMLVNSPDRARYKRMTTGKECHRIVDIIPKSVAALNCNLFALNDSVNVPPSDTQR